MAHRNIFGWWLVLCVSRYVCIHMCLGGFKIVVVRMFAKVINIFNNFKSQEVVTTRVIHHLARRDNFPLNVVVFANLSATFFTPNLVAPFVNKQLSTADSVLQVQTRHLSSLLTTVSQSPTKRRPEKSVKKNSFHHHHCAQSSKFAYKKPFFSKTSSRRRSCSIFCLICESQA